MLQKKVTQQVSLSSTRAFDVHVSMGAKSAYPLIVVIGEIFKKWGDDSCCCGPSSSLKMGILKHLDTSCKSPHKIASSVNKVME